MINSFIYEFIRYACLILIIICVIWRQNVLRNSKAYTCGNFEPKETNARLFAGGLIFVSVLIILITILKQAL